jgi:NAD(P)-dependent dehydrogenase (short-subunit alcohol dehydrogenase family)
VPGDRRLAVITGANRGIGLALAQRYAADGWDVIATTRVRDDAAALDDLRGSGASITVEQLDLADAASIASFVAGIGDRPIDVLLNNAGTMGPLPLQDHIHRQRFGGIDYDLWAEVLAVNTLGTVRLTEALIDNVAASSDRTIVMMSSSAGSIGGSDRTAIAYTTSKVALNKAATIIARAVEPRGVIVLVLCPGHVKTRLGIGGATVEIDDSVDGIRGIVASATMADSGRFIRYDGAAIPW